MSKSAEELAVMESEAREWIEAILGEPIPAGPLIPELKSGVVLCRLANAIQPGLVATPSLSKMPFKQSKPQLIGWGGARAKWQNPS